MTVWASALNLPLREIANQKCEVDPATYVYEGHTLPEWKLYLKTGQWKVKEKAVPWPADDPRRELASLRNSYLKTGQWRELASLRNS